MKRSQIGLSHRPVAFAFIPHRFITTIIIRGSSGTEEVLVIIFLTAFELTRSLIAWIRWFVFGSVTQPGNVVISFRRISGIQASSKPCSDDRRECRSTLCHSGFGMRLEAHRFSSWTRGGIAPGELLRGNHRAGNRMKFIERRKSINADATEIYRLWNYHESSVSGAFVATCVCVAACIALGERVTRHIESERAS